MKSIKNFTSTIKAIIILKYTKAELSIIYVLENNDKVPKKILSEKKE